MDDERYYLLCPLRKNQARIAVTVCHQKKCLFLASEGGRLRCGYDDPDRIRIGAGKALPKWPKVNRVDRDGLS
jgi:hypothetical protein